MENKTYKAQVNSIRRNLVMDIESYIEYYQETKKLPIYIDLPDDFKVVIQKDGIFYSNTVIVAMEEFGLQDLVLIHEKLENS